MALVKYNNNSLSRVTSAASFPAGAMTLIKTLTASSSANLSFVHGSSDVILDSTYPIYLFKFINIHPATNSVNFYVNFSIDSGSNYNVTKTTTFFRADHDEADSATALGYNTSNDLAQSTNFQGLGDIGNDNDQTLSGTLHLFNPSSTTFVKHFISTTNACDHADESRNYFVAGYGNTTSAIDAVQFKMSSGNMDAGKILMFGLN